MQYTVPFHEALYRNGSERAIWMWEALWWLAHARGDVAARRRASDPVVLEIPPLSPWKPVQGEQLDAGAYWDRLFDIRNRDGKPARDVAANRRIPAWRELVELGHLTYICARDLAYGEVCSEGPETWIRGGTGLGEQTVRLRDCHSLPSVPRDLAASCLGRLHPMQGSKRWVAALYAWLAWQQGIRGQRLRKADLAGFAAWRSPDDVRGYEKRDERIPPPRMLSPGEGLFQARAALGELQRMRLASVRRGEIVLVRCSGRPIPVVTTPCWDRLHADAALAPVARVLDGLAADLRWAMAERELVAREIETRLETGLDLERLVDGLTSMAAYYGDLGASPRGRLNEYLRSVWTIASRPGWTALAQATFSAGNAGSGGRESRPFRPLRLPFSLESLCAIRERLRLVIARGDTDVPVRILLNVAGTRVPIVEREAWTRPDGTALAEVRFGGEDLREALEMLRAFGPRTRFIVFAFEATSAVELSVRLEVQ